MPDYTDTANSSLLLGERMTGFQNLLFSSLMIASASVLSVNHDDLSGSIDSGMTRAIFGICGHDTLGPLMPSLMKCGNYQDMRVVERGR